MFSRLRRVLSLFLVLTVLMPGLAVGAWWGSQPTLLAINGQKYTADDFRHWWRYWQEGGEVKFSEATLDEFVDFHLLVQQGLAMDYDQRPGYLRKVEVFLKVQAMGKLKYEEVDSKVQVTEEEIREYFDRNYSPVRLLQILSFDTLEKARGAHAAMQPFQGHAAGRLIFADLQGGAPENRATYYDEVKVTPDDFSRDDRKEWLEIVRKLAVNEVSEPYLFAGGNKYLLFRVAGISLPEESEYLKKHKSIAEDLNKAARQRLTGVLMEKLKKKYRVEVDEELLREIKLDGEHSAEFLGRKLVTMTDLTITVSDFLRNSGQEMKLRAGLEPELLKSIALSGIVSQLLVDREALARGYEKEPPLSWKYEFYKQNRLRAEISSSLAEKVKVDEEEVAKYYRDNIGEFSLPEKLTTILVRGEKDTLDNIWLGVLQGGDLSEVAQKYSLAAPLRTQERDELPLAVTATLDRLDKDGLSEVFPLDKGYALVKLLKREPGKVHSLTQVREQILQRLKAEKLKALKEDYIKTLRNKSEIEINRSAWEDLSRELRR